MKLSKFLIICGLPLSYLANATTEPPELKFDIRGVSLNQEPTQFINNIIKIVGNENTNKNNVEIKGVGISFYRKKTYRNTKEYTSFGVCYEPEIEEHFTWDNYPNAETLFNKINVNSNYNFTISKNSVDQIKKLNEEYIKSFRALGKTTELLINNKNISRETRESKLEELKKQSEDLFERLLDDCDLFGIKTTIGSNEKISLNELNSFFENKKIDKKFEFIEVLNIYLNEKVSDQDRIHFEIMGSDYKPVNFSIHTDFSVLKNNNIKKQYITNEIIKKYGEPSKKLIKNDSLEFTYHPKVSIKNDYEEYKKLKLDTVLRYRNQDRFKELDARFENYTFKEREGLNGLADSFLQVTAQYSKNDGLVKSLKSELIHEKYSNVFRDKYRAYIKNLKGKNYFKYNSNENETNKIQL